MGLLTLQTKLATVLSAAQNLKIEALNYVNDLNYSISIGTIFGISSLCSYYIVEICDVYESDNPLSDYADLQFATSFVLLQKIATIKQLLQSAIDFISNITSPYTIEDLNNQNSVKVGEIIIVVSYLSENLTELKTTMQSIYDNIPD